MAGEAGPATNSTAAQTTPPADPTNQIVRLRQHDVLARVNGHAITVQQAVPIAGTNEDVEISPADLKFFLNRAVDRELIFETALKQRVFLDNSQNQQFANMQLMRNQHAPGDIAALNDDGAARQMEAADAKAFMLQTALMAAQGLSPDVTENQVLDYYAQHQSDYAPLPSDPMAHQQAWQQVAYQIRTLLAGSTRAAYNNGLAAYMQQMRSSADVVFNYSP